MMRNIAYLKLAQTNTPSSPLLFYTLDADQQFKVKDVYRYRCKQSGAPSNAVCFDDFARHLNRFFHGEHPTRITWYQHQSTRESVQPARKVYTGNYVFRPRALNWFIPFAPLRLRMSGPTLGRLMKAELGDKFISANLPMLHTRTLDATGEAEFRPVWLRRLTRLIYPTSSSGNSWAM